ncbi:HAMP domain-containing protein, partial [Candidatus Gracilibacteria bacterium]|nr:HAMP domain-containing protein [Candidatus Gracilibacteria bacterium]
MLLSRKIALVFFISIFAMAILNVIAFYGIYSINIGRYLSEKIDTRQEITLEYINSLVERQTLDELEQIFSESELEFFELLDTSGGVIPLDSERNVNIVLDFLVKSGISPRYLEEIIPENNLEKVLDSLRDPESPEAAFVERLIVGLVITNIIFLILIGLGVYFITQRTIKPLQKVTKTLSSYKLGERYETIEYHKNDEIGLLIKAINTLNRKLSLQDSIRTRLIADISHELKTPITSIQCYLEGISDGVIKLEPEVLDTLSDEMKRLTKLVNMILEFQKFESRNEPLKKSGFNPTKVIEDIIVHTQNKADTLGQNIFLKGSKNIELYGEKDLFKQLVYNVIGNFLK